MVRLLALALFSILAMGMVARMLPGGEASGARGGQGGIPAPSQRQPASESDYAGGDQTVIRRDGSGRFYLNADVNGQSTRFLVDTGADVVALTVDDARQLGIDVDPATFQPITRTASGTGYGAPVVIDRLDVAGRELQGVRAVVVDGLETNLLGQSVLRQLGRIELHGNAMTIG